MKARDISYYMSQTTDIVPSYEYPNSVCIVGTDGNTQYVHSMRTRSLTDIIASSQDTEAMISTVEFDREGINTVVILPDGDMGEDDKS